MIYQQLSRVQSHYQNIKVLFRLIDLHRACLNVADLPVNLSQVHKLHFDFLVPFLLSIKYL